MQNRAFNTLPLPQLRNLLLDPAPHKLVVLAGPCLEETGELLLQTGGFSPRHFLQVLGDKEVSCLLPILLPLALSPGHVAPMTCCLLEPHSLLLCGRMVVTHVLLLSKPSPIAYYSCGSRLGLWINQQTSQRPQMPHQIPGASWNRAGLRPF